MSVSYFGNELLQNAAAATGNGAVMNVAGYSTVGFQVSGTFSATLTFQCTIDGTNWVSLSVVPSAGGSAVTTTTSAGIWIGQVAGIKAVRVSVAWTSGTSVTVTALANVSS